MSDFTEPEYTRLKAQKEQILAEQAAKQVRTDVFYVVEKFERGLGVGYWNGDCFLQFIDDAIQFRRERDAINATIGKWPSKEVKITSHSYMKSAAPLKQTDKRDDISAWLEKTLNRPLSGPVDDSYVTIVKKYLDDHAAAPDDARELAKFRLMFYNAMNIAAMQGFPNASDCEAWLDNVCASAAKALDQIIWMSGSSDFSPGGQAHEGWKKSQPIINELMAATKRASLPQPSLPQENADSLNTNSVAGDGLKTTPSAGQTEGK